MHIYNICHFGGISYIFQEYVFNTAKVTAVITCLFQLSPLYFLYPFALYIQSTFHIILNDTYHPKYVSYIRSAFHIILTANTIAVCLIIFCLLLILFSYCISYNNSMFDFAVLSLKNYMYLLAFSSCSDGSAKSFLAYSAVSNYPDFRHNFITHPNNAGSFHPMYS